MSEAVSALDNASYAGFVEVTEMGLQGMITLRGDLSSAAMKKAVKAAVGVDVPEQRKMAMADGKGAGWMSPDELLLLVPYAEVEKTVAGLHKSLAKAHSMVVNVSDARVMFRLKGAGVREVLAKVAPVDLSAEAFGQGDLRRSRIAQVAAAFWMSGEDEFTLVAFRSVADYVFGVLKTGAQPGSEVGYL